MVRKQEMIALQVRFPKDVKDWVENEAARNCASQNSEIIRTIRAMMEKQPERIAG